MKKNNTERLKGGLRIKGLYNKKSVSSKPLVSIITICLNSDKYIEKTIKSVLEQTYKNIEYIIIDGDSRDKTLDIIRKYEDKINIWISESDKGLYDAMNKGIQLASGELIGIINSDDYYLYKTVEEVVKYYLRNPDIDVFYGNLIIISPSSERVGIKKGQISRNAMNRFIITINHPTCFIKKNAYLEYGYYDQQAPIGADRDLIMRILRGGGSFFHIDGNLSVFRLGGITSDYSFQAIKRNLWQEAYILKKNNFPFFTRLQRLGILGLRLLRNSVLSIFLGEMRFARIQRWFLSKFRF